MNGLIDDEELPYVFSFLPKVLLALVVSVLDEVYKKLAVWLTFKGIMFYQLISNRFTDISHVFCISLT